MLERFPWDITLYILSYLWAYEGTDLPRQSLPPASLAQAPPSSETVQPKVGRECRMAACDLFENQLLAQAWGERFTNYYYEHPPPFVVAARWTPKITWVRGVATSWMNALSQPLNDLILSVLVSYHANRKELLELLEKGESGRKALLQRVSGSFPRLGRRLERMGRRRQRRHPRYLHHQSVGRRCSYTKQWVLQRRKDSTSLPL